MRQPGLFRSFWMAGYEGADHINGKGIPLSMNEANDHNHQIDIDYDLLSRFNIKTVRESIGWRTTDSHHQPKWESLELKAAIAQQKEIQVIWTLMHYGFPTNLDPFGPKFVSEFASFCERVARKLLPYHDEAPFYQPINEISFLAWAVTSTGLIHPYSGSLHHRSGELKRQLVLAAIKGTEAIWSVDPRARIIHTDPLINIVPPYAATLEQYEDAGRHTEYAFQAWDMLSGIMEPGLGGSKQHLDIIGMNYYHNNQWEHGTSAPLDWHLKDPRRLPFNVLAEQIWQRYERPMFIAETSHFGEGRAQWLEEISTEVIICEKRGIPIDGICLYPIIDRPDWENSEHWHNSGLWDIQLENCLKPDSTGQTQPENFTTPSPVKLSEFLLSKFHHILTSTMPTANLSVQTNQFERILNQPYANQLQYWQTILPLQPVFKGFLQHFATGVIPMQTIIVFSHLRWNFVYQRPQHLLSRLANIYKIIFVEEPVNDAYDNYLERSKPNKNVVVLRPHLNTHINGFSDDNAAEIRALLDQYLNQHEINNFWLWFYTPLALSITKNLSNTGVIYDCMDELSAFKNASSELIEKEEELFKIADIVFTGGPSLYQSKKMKHDNVYCFASSVDAEHYAPKTSAIDRRKISSIILSEDSDSSNHKVLGYFGVIDERIDTELIQALASFHPEWEIIMVGPVVKIDAEALPKNANIKWLGQKSYEELPHLIAQWDVCLMPFALNESTRFISPTKTLEYMAAERPIVSTNIRDVSEPYGHVVPIGYTHGEFIRLCEEILDESIISRNKRIKTMREIVANTSWDKTALAMHRVITEFQNDHLPLIFNEDLLLIAKRLPTENQSANKERLDY